MLFCSLGWTNFSRFYTILSTGQPALPAHMEDSQLLESGKRNQQQRCTLQAAPHGVVQSWELVFHSPPQDLHPLTMRTLQETSVLESTHTPFIIACIRAQQVASRCWEAEIDEMGVYLSSSGNPDGRVLHYSTSERQQRHKKLTRKQHRNGLQESTSFKRSRQRKVTTRQKSAALSGCSSKPHDIQS